VKEELELESNRDVACMAYAFHGGFYSQSIDDLLLSQSIVEGTSYVFLVFNICINYR
jgi:hypothetical protein